MESQQSQLPQLQVPAATHSNGNDASTLQPILPTTNVTSMPQVAPWLQSQNDIPQLAPWLQSQKDMTDGESEEEKKKNKRDTRIKMVLLAIFGVLFILLFGLIGGLYHPSPEKTGRPESNGITMSDTKGAITGTLTAKIPAASANGVDIDVFMAQETYVPALKARQITPALPVDKEDIKVIKPRENSDASISNALEAPPYLDACKINIDCDWGYRCIEGTCYPGCDSNIDCRHGQTCGHWKHDGPSYKYCMVKPHKECGTHLEFCHSGDDCCSGHCGSKGKWKLCFPTRGRSNQLQDLRN